MKKLTANIVIYILLANIFYVGSGVNFVHYCCSSCSNLGIEALKIEACHSSDDECCDQPTPLSHHHDGGDHCKLERRSIDMELSHHLFKLPTPLLSVFVLSELPTVVVGGSDLFCRSHVAADPPLLDAQRYRSKICIWII